MLDHAHDLLVEHERLSKRERTLSSINFFSAVVAGAGLASFAVRAIDNAALGTVVGFLIVLVACLLSVKLARNPSVEAAVRREGALSDEFTAAVTNAGFQVQDRANWADFMRMRGLPVTNENGEEMTLRIRRHDGKLTIASVPALPVLA